MNKKYDVGGVQLDRPFKIRRFGHFGYNVEKLDEAVKFYTDILGFRKTDETSLFDELEGKVLEIAKNVVTDPRMYFTTHASDHHALLLAHKTFGTFNRNDKYSPDNTMSQITWQVGSLAEVVNSIEYLKEKNVRIGRIGRDMPGGNWHVYFLDPDGNTLELYYGMEQLGWQRKSKPKEMHYRGFTDSPELPQMSEWAELLEAYERDIDIDSGWQPKEAHLEETHNVEGILLPRPFKVTKLGPVSMFTDKLEEMTEFYVDVMGFAVSERAEVNGADIVYLRHGTEHHSLVLVEKSIREMFQLSDHSSNFAMGMEVGTYRQLVEAREFLTEQGYTERADLPAELHLGMDYVTYFEDPDGHLVQLYYYMENIGWDGKARPADTRRKLESPWPVTVEPLSDTYVDQTFMGPLG